MDYYDIYEKRLKRWGETPQEIVQNKRERQFEDYLKHSTYRIDLSYDGKDFPACFERYKQDKTETLAYLLTRVSTKLPAGIIVEIPDKDNIPNPWMVYYKETIPSPGYNRYILLKMSHQITWTGRDKQSHTTYAYFFGRTSSALKDTLKSKTNSVLYAEDMNLDFFVCPISPYIQKDDYFEIETNGIKTGYRVTGYDVVSTEGVEYVTVDVSYLRDDSEPPQKTETDNDDDFYWLGGNN